ncbi:MAG: enoyl-CoA hydratase/isomerase family protein [Balneolales bacterium]
MVNITRKDHIIRAEVNRPDSKNAINFEVMEELELVLSEIEENTAIRVFILSGAGDEYFISGGDLKDFAGLQSGREGREMATRMTNILHRIESGRFWSMACINGDAYGGGCEMLLAFDFSIARKTARFGFTQGRFALPPGWGGLTRLVERVGRSQALDWLGRSAVIPADAAYNAGLINRLSVAPDLVDNTWAWAGQFCGMDPDLISGLKTGARFALEASRRESFDHELEQFGRFWGRDGHHEKVAAFIRKGRKG